MSQRSTFFEYVAKQDVNVTALAEMAQVRKEFAIQFDKQDYLYLSHFPRETNIWMQAIQYRYSPKVLLNPDVETHDISLVHNGGKPGQKTVVYKDVPTFTKHLIEKLSKQSYNIAKVDLKNNQGRFAARTAAKKALDFSEKGMPKDFEDDKNAVMHLRNALYEKGEIPDKDKGFEALNKVPPRNPALKHNPVDKIPIELDADDREYLQYFIDANEKGHKFSLPKALQMRYSKKLVTDPQARESQYGGEPGQYFDIHFSTGTAQKVPVNAQRLKAKLEKLNDNGYDFYNVMLPLDSAANWIRKGKYEPGLGRKGTTNYDRGAVGTKKMETIYQWIKKQDDWLDGKTDEEPMIRGKGGVFRDFNYEVPWGEILKQESEIAARKAIRFMTARAMSLDRIRSQMDEEILASDILAHLSREETVTNPQYGDQNWRLSKAIKFGTIRIKDVLNWSKDVIHRGGGAGGSTSALTGKDLDVAEKDKITRDTSVSKHATHNKNVEPEDEPKSTKSVYEDDPQAVWKAVDILQNTPDGKLIPDSEVNWNAVAQEYLNRVVAWSKENGGAEPTKAQTMMIAKDLLRPLVPTGLR
jgi:hypothetical protein